MPSSFHAFISYSRKDKAFAALLEKALESYRHPSPDQKTLKLEVFRDEDDFAGSEYKKAIYKHLNEAGKLIVICSPAARASAYVDEEIRIFASLHGSENIVPVILSGLPNNEAKENEEALMAFPPALCELMEMPLAVDYRQFDIGRNRVDKGSCYGPWCMLLANLLDTSRDIIDERIRKRRTKLLRTAIAVVSVVVLALASLAIWALIEKRNAVQRAEIILAEKLVSQSKAGGSLEVYAVQRRALLALEGMRRLEQLNQPIYNAASALLETLSLLPKKILTLTAGQNEFAFSDNGLEAFSSAGNLISVYNLMSGKRVEGMEVSEPVRQIFVSEDGQSVGASLRSGKLMLWQYPGWHPWKEISIPADEQIMNAEFDKEGTHVAIISVNKGSGKPAFIRVWQKDLFQQVAEYGIKDIGETLSKPSHGSSLLFSKNSIIARIHVKVDDDSLTTILWRWRPVTNSYGAVSPPIDKGLYITWRSKDAALSPNGESLYIAGKAQSATDNGNTIITIVNPANGYETVGANIKNPQQISINGTVAIRAEFTEDPYVPLLKYSTFTSSQTSTGKELGRVTEFSGACWLSPGGNFILTAVGSRVRLWGTTGGKEMFRIPVNNPITNLEFSSSERYLSTHNTDGSIDIWDLASPSELLRLQGSKILAMADNGSFMIKGVSGGIMMTDNLTGENSVYPIEGVADKTIISPGEKYLAVSTGDTWDFSSAIQKKSTALVDLRSGKQLIVSDTSETISAFSKSGDSLLLGEKSGLLKFIHTASGKIIWTKKLTGDALTRIHVSPDGKLAVVAMAAKWGYSYQLFVLDLSTGKVKMEIKRSSDIMAIDPTSTKIATVKADTVEITEIENGRIVNTFKHPEQYATLRQIVFKAGTGHLITVSGNRAGNFMASFFTGQALFEWDIKSAKMLRQFPEGLSKQLDYQKSLSEEEIPYFSDVLCSAGGKYVGLIQYSSRLNYWAVPSEYAVSELRVLKLDGLLPVEVLRFPCKYEEVNKLQAIAERTGIVVTSGDNIRSWSLSGGQLFKEGCLRVSRNFTVDEWNEYVGENEPYCETCPGLSATTRMPITTQKTGKTGP